MGFGSDKQSLQRKRYYCKAKSKDKDAKVPRPHFEIWTKDEEDEIVRRVYPVGHKLAGQFWDENEISGFMLEIKHSQYEYEGKINKMIHLLLIDESATEYKIDFTVDTFIGRSLINKIVTETQPEWITVRMYVKDEFPNLYISNNDNTMNWKFDHKTEIEPLITEYMDPKAEKMVKVYKAVNNKLLEEWIKHEPIIAANAKRLGLIQKRTVPQLAASIPNAAQLGEGVAQLPPNPTQHRPEDGPAPDFTGHTAADEPPADLGAPDTDDLPF